jgi:hypothetical protein
MADVLKIYGGNITSGAKNGYLISETGRHISLSAFPDNAVRGVYAMRCVDTSHPACLVKTYFSGDMADDYLISTDGFEWAKELRTLYVADNNILFYIKVDVPIDAVVGTNSNTYLVNDYLGGV